MVVVVATGACACGVYQGVDVGESGGVWCCGGGLLELEWIWGKIPWDFGAGIDQDGVMWVGVRVVLGGGNGSGFRQK